MLNIIRFCTIVFSLERLDYRDTERRYSDEEMSMRELKDRHRLKFVKIKRFLFILQLMVNKKCFRIV